MKVDSPYVIIVSSPSGVGKTSLIYRALPELPGVARGITHTTRKPRENETDGIDYYFVSESEFERLKADNAFVESAAVYGHHYGTSRSEINRILSENKHCLLVIDVQGAQLVRKCDQFRLFSLFIQGPSKEAVMERLANRGTEDEAYMKIRVEQYEYEMAHAVYYNEIIVNHDFDKALKQFVAVIRRLTA